MRTWVSGSTPARNGLSSESELGIVVAVACADGPELGCFGPSGRTPRSSARQQRARPVIKQRARTSTMGLANRDRRTLLRRLGAAGSLALLRRSGVGAGLLTPITARAQLAPDVWDEFRRRFVTNDGRVLDDDGATHSEGLG